MRPRPPRACCVLPPDRSQPDELIPGGVPSAANAATWIEPVQYHPIAETVDFSIGIFLVGVPFFECDASACPTAPHLNNSTSHLTPRRQDS